MNEDEKVFTFVAIVPWIAKGKRYSISLLNQHMASCILSGHPFEANQSELFLILVISTRFACTAVACPVNLHKVTSISFFRACDISHKHCFVILLFKVPLTSHAHLHVNLYFSNQVLLYFIINLFLVLLQFHSQPSVQALHSHGHHPLTHSSMPPRSR